MDAPLHAVALMGATCSGKSSLAMKIAGEIGVSIVCCDSMQVYRGLDIGTAKANAAERAAVRHLMLDCCDLPDVFSAARWAKEAAACIREENMAGRRPLIVGGTGLYLKALCEGFADIPAEKTQVRADLQQRCDAQGIEVLHAQLADVDAETAARLNPNDTQRILRALSVFLSSGKPLSAWFSEAAPKIAVDIPVFVLNTERDALRDKIAERFHAMLNAGWLDEVDWLNRLHLSDTHPALRAVGYRQLQTYVRGDCTLDEATTKGITATRHYAKRQRTWFSHQTANAVCGDAASLMPLIATALTKNKEQVLV